MKNIVAIVLCFSLLGCTTVKPIPEYVPIVPPPVKILQEPDLPIYHLRKGDKAPIVYDAFIRSVKILKSYSLYLKKVHEENAAEIPVIGKNESLPHNH